MPRTSTSRKQFLEGAARLLRRHGYNGVGLKAITEEAGAPWGSLYHYFPGGKTQLAVEAVTRSGAGYRHLIDKVFSESADPVHGVARFFQLAADALERSEFGDGCPIATTALDTASSNDDVREACAAVFDLWLSDLAAVLTPAVGSERARRVGLLSLCALEGAIILSRASRSTQPLLDAAAEIEALIRASVGR